METRVMQGTLGIVYPQYRYSSMGYQTIGTRDFRVFFHGTPPKRQPNIWGQKDLLTWNHTKASYEFETNLAFSV